MFPDVENITLVPSVLYYVNHGHCSLYIVIFYEGSFTMSDGKYNYVTGAA